MNMETGTVIDLTGLEIGGVKLINLCPHDLHFYGANQELLHTVAKSGIVARIGTTQEVVGSIDTITIARTSYGKVEGLPPHDTREKNTYYLVSTMVAQVVCRPDVLSPDTFNGVVRDTKRQIMGVTQLQSFYPGRV